MSVHRSDLGTYLEKLLHTRAMTDRCPNGLQVQGKATIQRIVTGVSASESWLRAACAYEPDALIVHHGLFWKGENPCVVGWKYQRLLHVFETGSNLFAFHLPLDTHPELGNNVQIAAALGWETECTVRSLGVDDILSIGYLQSASSVSTLAECVLRVTDRTPLVIASDVNRLVRKIAWCTGAAGDMLEQALDYGVDAFITGEVCERHVHIARESQVALIAGGHHATERFGVRALGDHLAQQFSVEHIFVDDDSPL